MDTQRSRSAGRRALAVVAAAASLLVAWWSIDAIVVAPGLQVAEAVPHPTASTAGAMEKERALGPPTEASPEVERQVVAERGRIRLRVRRTDGASISIVPLARAHCSAWRPVEAWRAQRAVEQDPVVVQMRTERRGVGRRSEVQPRLASVPATCTASRAAFSFAQLTP